jgi:hypothetical protein
MLVHGLQKKIEIGKERSLNRDEALFDYFWQRTYQIVMTAIKQTEGGKQGSIQRYYRQALVYLEGLELMIRYGDLDPKLKEQAKLGIGTFFKILAEMHLVATQRKKKIVGYRLE